MLSWLLTGSQVLILYALRALTRQEQGFISVSPSGYEVGMTEYTQNFSFFWPLKHSLFNLILWQLDETLTIFSSKILSMIFKDLLNFGREIASNALGPGHNSILATIRACSNKSNLLAVYDFSNFLFCFVLCVVIG